MAGGSFQTSREIFEHPVWQDVTKFRLFFYIYGNAIFAKEGVRTGGILVKRGQYLRSYRNLVSDLEYIENRQVKKYSISTIKRTVDKLVKENRLLVEDTELGTLFTVVNYEMYQGFGSIPKEEPETAPEQWRNSDGTAAEQSRNNNNKGNKVKKDNKEDYTPKIKDLLGRYESIPDFNKLNKEYWDVIRETRKNGKVSPGVIYNNMSKWEKYEPIVVQYSLKAHVEVYAGMREEYTLGIMRNTTKEDAEDRLNKKTSLKTGTHKKSNEIDWDNI